MFFTRARRRMTTWFALWVLLLSVCAPTVAQAVARQTTAGWLEVCTSTGMIRVRPNADAVAANASEADQAAASHAKTSSGPISALQAMNGCDWCLLHGGATGVPPQPALWQAVAPLADWPPAYYQSATVATAWQPAQSRAPPAA